jgi:hypothetical protein
VIPLIQKLTTAATEHQRRASGVSNTVSGNKCSGRNAVDENRTTGSGIRDRRQSYMAIGALRHGLSVGGMKDLKYDLHHMSCILRLLKKRSKHLKLLDKFKF